MGGLTFSVVCLLLVSCSYRYHVSCRGGRCCRGGGGRRELYMIEEVVAGGRGYVGSELADGRE